MKKEESETIQKPGKEDFKVPDPVKWCAGCGGHVVLNSVQSMLPELGVEKENIVFVSGIGCSSRFPYYINTYGFHGTHGRAIAIASGIKVGNPKLSVWVVTGDGDMMAIGGNHFIHILRRNIDINILLFNNKIYGLTKGQYSPTTPKGGKTKTSPFGTIENPFNPGELAIGSQGTFYARVVDTEPKMMREVFLKAAQHRGTSLVEVLQNCVIFSNKIHSEITGRDVKDDHQIYLEHGKPMIFGKEKNKGLVLDKLRLKVVTIGEDGYTMDDVLIHDENNSDPTLHYMLARMSLPEYPVAMGVIRSYRTSVYEELLAEQINSARDKSPIKTMDDLLNSGNVFEVK
jgi:2-oxoglutarate ferredoxin oxidoreductase subunit beta